MKTAEQYMIALTAEERTPSVKAMVDIILLDAAKAIDDTDVRLRDTYQEGYDDGYEAGKDVGYDQGFEDGHTQGYEEAKESEA